jgi:ribokinase
LKNLAILVVNRSEAGYLMRDDRRSDNDLMAAAASLQARGPRTVVVTAGADGAFVADGEERFHVPAHLVDVVDTTGAGDAFVGVLAARISQGVGLREALVDASGSAAAAVQVRGAQLTQLPGQAAHEPAEGSPPCA